MKSKIKIINILMLLASVLTIPAHSFAQSAPVTETGCQEGISRAIVNVSAAYLRLIMRVRLRPRNLWEWL